MSTAPEPRSARRSSGRAARPGRGGQVDEDTRRERLEQFHATLSEQVLTLTSSTAWTNWLQTAARFHHYSLNNTLSIWAQRPDATHVAGYRTWQSLGRQVRKGEQGIKILAPVTRRPDQSNAAGGEESGGGPGRPAERTGDRPAGESSPRRMVGVRIAHVFDYSQTEGHPLADFEAIRPTLLTGQAPDRLWDGLALQVAEAGFELGDEALSNGANGRTNFTDRTVLLRPELDPAQRVKTLTHELAHISLHAPQDGVDGPATLSCRGRQEVEAESVAFLVASAHGMDTASYSFPYVAGWAQHDGDNVEATLRETAGRALSTAHRILDRLDRDNPAPLPVAEDARPRVVAGPAGHAGPPGRRRAPAPRRPWTGPDTRRGDPPVTAASAAEGAGQAPSRRRIKAAYERRRYQQKRAGTWSPFTSTGPVREHLHQLYSSGMTQEQISRVAGVSVTAMYRATKRARMSTAAAQAVLAVQPTEDCQAAELARQALRALVADGWTLLQLADAAGLSIRTMGRTVHGRSTPLPATAAVINDVHQHLSLQDPGDGAPATASRLRAARAGWQPSTRLPDDDVVDSVAVHRAVHGDVVPLRPAEQQIALHQLAGIHPDHEIGRRLGISSRTVLRHRYSQGLPAYGSSHPADPPSR